MNKYFILNHPDRICENTTCNKRYKEHEKDGACGDFISSGKRICIYDKDNVIHCFTNCIERECPSCGSVTDMYGQINGDAYIKLKVQHMQESFYDQKVTMHICQDCGLVSYYKIDQMMIDFVYSQTGTVIFPEISEGRRHA